MLRPLVFATPLVAAALVGCNRQPTMAIELPEGTVVAERDNESGTTGLLAGLPNLDDESGSGQPDWDDRAITDAENDLSTFVVHAPTRNRDNRFQKVLELEGDLENIRVWNGSGEVILGDDGSDPITRYTLEAPEDTRAYHVEFGDFMVEGTIWLRYLDDDGEEVARGGFDLVSSPLILNHHLQPTERVWIMDTGGGNQAMRDELRDVLGDQLIEVPVTDYGWDVWIQDEIELANMVSQEHRVEAVIDSVRDRGLRNFAHNELEEPNMVVVRENRDPGDGPVNTLDAFGNLEISPPVTVNGIHYPFGRIYYGGTDDWQINPALQELLSAQRLQRPFMIDSSWLAVAHVDEWITFVPDRTAPKGFRMLYADTNLGYELLDDMDPSTDLPRYAADKGVSTAGAFQDAAAIRALNEDFQHDYLDPQREIMMEELGLDEEDVILIPAIFEDVGMGRGAAKIPGTANLLVANDTEGDVHLFMPDPFMRADEGAQGSDPFIQWFHENLPEELGQSFVDNWYVYHLALGEVHCGTNVQRTPTAAWWRGIPGPGVRSLDLRPQAPQD